MSAGSISLESAIRTCKVNTAYANKIESDRFLNPNNMVCPIWNGVDAAGRPVCPDSYYTKRAGCNSAQDRVSVENNVSRPQYMEYITLSANGIKGHMYGNRDSVVRTKDLDNVNNITGRFGQQSAYGGEIYPNCGASPYQEALNMDSQEHRQGESFMHANNAHQTRKFAGF
jgi:hypothetical protein